MLLDSVPVELLYPCGKAHHITFRFGVLRWCWRWFEGRSFTAITQYVAWNDRIQAIAVQLPWWVRLLCNNKHPHVTVSRVTDAKSVESNAMLKQPDRTIPLRVRLRCAIEFSPF